MKNEKIRFVRIKGRVVPIKVKADSFKPKRQVKPKKMSKETKFALQSSAFTVAGLATSIGAGKLSSKKFKQARHGKQMAFDLMGEAGGVIPEKIKQKAILQKIKRAKQFSSAGQVLGGALLSQAVQRGLRSQGIEIDSPIIDVGAEAGSQVASHLIARQSSKMLKQKKKFHIKVPSAFTRLAKDFGTRFIKKQLRLKI